MQRISDTTGACTIATDQCEKVRRARLTRFMRRVFLNVCALCTSCTPIL